MGAGAFRTVPGGPGATSAKIGPSETIVSPGAIPQHSVPLPLRQQRRPNHGRSGRQKQQPDVNSRLATTISDIQRARTMRCVPLSRNGPNGPGDDSREPGQDVETEDRGLMMEDREEQIRLSIFDLRSSIFGPQGPTPSGGNPRSQSCPRNLRKPNRLRKENGPRLVNRGPGRFRSTPAG